MHTQVLYIHGFLATPAISRVHDPVFKVKSIMHEGSWLSRSLNRKILRDVIFMLCSASGRLCF